MHGFLVALFILGGRDVASQCRTHVIVLPRLSPAVGRVGLHRALGCIPAVLLRVNDPAISSFRFLNMCAL